MTLPGAVEGMQLNLRVIKLLQDLRIPTMSEFDYLLWFSKYWNVYAT